MWIEYISFTDEPTGNYILQGYAVDEHGLGRGLRAALTSETLLENDERFLKKFHQWFRDECERGMRLLQNGFVYTAPTEDDLAAYVWADEIVSISSAT